MERFKKNDTFTCLFLTACYTGMRTGEVCALSWNNIDLEKRVINIKHNVYSKVKDEKGRWSISTPKTANSDRQVYITDTLLIALKNYKNKQDYQKKIYGKKYHYYHLEDVTNKYGKIVEHRIVQTQRNSKKLEPIKLVFTKKDGKYSGTDIIKYPFKVINYELKIDKCRFYDLRGSFATGALRSGTEIKDIADLLGHSNVQTTESYYISSTEETRKTACVDFGKTIQSNTIKEIIKYK